MEWTEIIIAFIGALFGSTGIITIYLKSRLDKAQKHNDDVKKIDERIFVQKAAKERYKLDYDELLCRKVNGEQMNGELKEAFREYKLQCEVLQKLYDERAAILRQR
jgi:hypothetical protein